MVDYITNKFIFSCKLQTSICMKYSLGCCGISILSACHIINWQWSHKRIMILWVIFANITILASSWPLHMPTENHSEKYLGELRRLALSSNCCLLSSVKLYVHLFQDKCMRFKGAIIFKRFSWNIISKLLSKAKTTEYNLKSGNTHIAVAWRSFLKT